VSDYCAANGVSGEQVAELIRARMRSETRLTCSCGVAPNKMLAKVRSAARGPHCRRDLPATRLPPSCLSVWPSQTSLFLPACQPHASAACCCKLSYPSLLP
jgi:hypothetical protein